MEKVSPNESFRYFDPVQGVTANFADWYFLYFIDLLQDINLKGGRDDLQILKHKNNDSASILEMTKRIFVSIENQ